MRSERARPARQQPSAAPISEGWKSARSAMQACSNSPKAISNTAMSWARLARDGNGLKRADSWWPGAGGTRRGHEDPVGLRVRAPSPLHTAPASSDVPDTARGAGAGRSKEGYMDRSPRPSHGYSSRTIARFAWPRVYSRPLSKRNRAVQRVLGMGVAVERVTYILAGVGRCA